MALFEHGILGKVKGAVGDVVVKSNKGTDYSSKRIRHYKKTTSEPLIDNRSIFQDALLSSGFLMMHLLSVLSGNILNFLAINLTIRCFPTITNLSKKIMFLLCLVFFPQNIWALSGM